jgi:hypothetical protein
VDAAQASLIRLALDRYLTRSDERDAPYRNLARQHSLLPVLPDWSGFVGLREDGALFWVSDDDGSVSSNLTQHIAHLATLRGPELFPELGFLAPVPSSDWVDCSSCGGSGNVVVDGQHVDDVRCQCGGLGRLPAAVAQSLRARDL